MTAALLPVAVSVWAIIVSFPFRCFLSFLISDHHTTLASITAYHPPKRRAKEITIRYLPRFHIAALIVLASVYQVAHTRRPMAGSTEISVQNLTYSHGPSVPASLSNINIALPKGSRTLLIGANGGVHSPHNNRWPRLLMLIFISWEINTASNFGRQAAGNIQRGASPSEGMRRVSPFPTRCHVPRHRMGSFLRGLTVACGHIST